MRQNGGSGVSFDVIGITPAVSGLLTSVCTVVPDGHPSSRHQATARDSKIG
jgi:hypothetical protein